MGLFSICFIGGDTCVVCPCIQYACLGLPSVFPAWSSLACGLFALSCSHFRFECAGDNGRNTLLIMLLRMLQSVKQSSDVSIIIV